jgi:F5/8 type C domain
MKAMTVGLLLLTASFAYAPPPRPAPPVDTSKPSSNAVLKADRGKVVASASTEYHQTWAASRLIDGEEETSWFSSASDTATVKGTTPWVKLAFPADVTVKRVTILGNREPQYPSGYSVLAGKLELLDEKGKVLESKELKAAGEKFDLDFVISAAGVRAIKFTITDDQGDKNGSKDCALAEIQIE